MTGQIVPESLFCYLPLKKELSTSSLYYLLLACYDCLAYGEDLDTKGMIKIIVLHYHKRTEIHNNIP